MKVQISNQKVETTAEENAAAKWAALAPTKMDGTAPIAAAPEKDKQGPEVER